jgi:DNA-3-methyladenine glycosylase
VARRYPRSSLARPAHEVAPALLGAVLARRLPGGLVRARIVEVEAYEADDPASHAFRGRTARNDVMFGHAGHLYVYFTYGMHYCMNVVTGRDGEGSAVLLRAGEPIEGLDLLRHGRTPAADRNLCRGPARWTAAFEVDRGLNGADLIAGDGIWLERGRSLPQSAIASTPRIGIRQAADVPWRFTEERSAWLSNGPSARRHAAPGRQASA